MSLLKYKVCLFPFWEEKAAKDQKPDSEERLLDSKQDCFIVFLSSSDVLDFVLCSDEIIVNFGLCLHTQREFSEKRDLETYAAFYAGDVVSHGIHA